MLFKSKFLGIFLTSLYWYYFYVLLMISSVLTTINTNSTISRTRRAAFAISNVPLIRGAESNIWFITLAGQAGYHNTATAAAITVAMVACITRNWTTGYNVLHENK